MGGEELIMAEDARLESRGNQTRKLEFCVSTPPPLYHISYKIGTGRLWILGFGPGGETRFPLFFDHLFP